MKTLRFNNKRQTVWPETSICKSILQQLEGPSNDPSSNPNFHTQHCNVTFKYTQAHTSSSRLITTQSRQGTHLIFHNHASIWSQIWFCTSTWVMSAQSCLLLFNATIMTAPLFPLIKISHTEKPQSFHVSVSQYYSLNITRLSTTW